MSLNIGVDYKKTELTSSVRQVELAQRVYTQLVAAGIYLDAESKNRFFADAATIVDNTSFAFWCDAYHLPLERRHRAFV